MPTIVTRLGKGSPLTTAELDANLTNINAETVDNSGVFNLRPSLDIDLVGSKSVSPLVSFSRSSTGTYFDSDGLLKTAGVNQPRFDYDPVTGELKGLLVEGQGTNLILNSSGFNTGNWGAISGSSTSPAIVATNIADPTGGNAAQRITFGDITSSGAYSAIKQDFSSTAGSTYTRSIFIKASTASDVGKVVVFYFGNSTPADFRQIVLTNSWQRVSYSAAVSGTATTFAFGSLGSTYGGLNQNSFSVDIWGAQLEAGSTPTSYIPTTSTAVTRSADQLSINKTSNWFNSTNGTLSLSHDAASGKPLLGDGSTTVISSLGAGTVNIDYSNTQLSVVTQSGQSNNTTGIFNFDTDLYIGGNSTSKINNHIKYLKFYPNNLINSTPDGSGFILDDGYALLQEDGSVLLQE